MTKQIEERKASGETRRVFHEIRQVLRVDGINLNFRTWAGFKSFFPTMWDTLRPNLETKLFENGCDRLRAKAVRIASQIGQIKACSLIQMGESRLVRLRRAIELYHYINPKLLLMTSSLRLALDGDPIVQQVRASHPTLIEAGVPDQMYPMEMEVENPHEKYLAVIFDDIKKTLKLPAINSDYRTLALWPDYLRAYWKSVKPLILLNEYHKGAVELQKLSREITRTLPLPITLSKGKLESMGENAKRVIETTIKFETLLPSLILNIAFATLESQALDTACQSPFPAKVRRAA